MARNHPSNAPQIVRQPAPYTSQCLDSWTGTGIDVPNNTIYSLAVNYHNNYDLR